MDIDTDTKSYVDYVTRAKRRHSNVDEKISAHNVDRNKQLEPKRAQEIADSHDGLILNHLDWIGPRSSDEAQLLYPINLHYDQNLGRLISAFLTAKKPIVIIPPIKYNEDIYEQTKDALNVAKQQGLLHEMPHVDGEYQEIAVSSIKFISDLLKKKPADISLVGGGLMADHCVFGNLRDLTANLVTHFSNDKIPMEVHLPKDQTIGKIEILDEIV